MMAQLPPKVPNMYSLWPSFPHQRAPSMNNMLSISSTSQPSWVEGFTDFSPHRRSASDSIAFLECQSEATGMGPSDEQLMSMFSDDISAMGPPANSTSNPSSSSDHDEKSTPLDQQPRNEPEVQSPCQTDTQITTPTGDPITDPKRVKRILANRQSAQRSRVRKLQYVTDLERSVATLQTEVSALSPRVAFLDHQRLVLNIDNSALKQRIAALAQDKIFKDAHQEALKKEVERLRQVYYQQALNKMDSSGTNTCSEPYIYTETATQLK